ncbi:MAG: Sjogren's syndrome/scleroderma autoantigen 1 family protein, partial [Candidatus Bathyarchaeia archaeon]
MAGEASSSDKVKLMADLLRSGAVLTDLSCPACASPLFRLRSGEIWCAQCQKKVVIVKEEEEAKEVETLATLSQTETTIMMKIWEINERLR